MSYPLFRNMIIDIAHTYKLDYRLVAAICEHESSWNPFAWRYEPTYQWLNQKAIDKKPTPAQKALERFGQMCSWGLGQMMGATARDLGLGGNLPSLCDPKTSITFTCIYLSRLFAKFEGDENHVIAAYNGGPGVKIVDDKGNFSNQTYVASILTIKTTII